MAYAYFCPPYQLSRALGPLDSLWGASCVLLPLGAAALAPAAYPRLRTPLAQWCLWQHMAWLYQHSQFMHVMPPEVFATEMFCGKFLFLAMTSLMLRLPFATMALTEPVRAAVSLSQLRAICAALAQRGGAAAHACVAGRAARAALAGVALPLAVVYCLELRARKVFLQVTVKSLPGEPNMTIQLTLGAKQRSLNRRAAASGVPPPDVALHSGPSPDSPALDPGSTTNEAAWQPGRLLRVGDQRFVVELNPPWVARLALFGRAFSGIPLVPALEMHCGEAEASLWLWSRRMPGSQEWQPILGATARRFTPGPEDVGAALRVECTPRRAGPPPAAGAPAAAEAGPVGAAPGPLGAAPRLAQTRAPAACPELRVITYNILADQYAGTQIAVEALAHCPLEFQARPGASPAPLPAPALPASLRRAGPRRRGSGLAFGRYDGVHSNKAGRVREGPATFWRRARFQALARASLPLKRLFPPAPGGAPRTAAARAFAPMLATWPSLAADLQKIATVAQLTLLVPSAREGQQRQAPEGQRACAGAGGAAADGPPGARAAAGGAGGTGGAGATAADAPLCLVNTHLYFHDSAPHVRTMHAWAILHEAAALVARHARALQAAAPPDAGGGGAAAGGGGGAPRGPAALVFCGDLNCGLSRGVPGVVELLRSGRLAADYWDWERGRGFVYGSLSRDCGGSEEGRQQEGGGGAGGQRELRAGGAGGGGGAAAAAGARVAQMSLGAGDARVAAGAAGPQQQQEPAQAQEQQAREQQAREQVESPQQQEQRGDARQQQGAGQAEARPQPCRADHNETGAGPSGAAAGVDLEIPFRLAAANGADGVPTHYTRDFCGLLDYVWYEAAALEAAREVPPPAAADLGGLLPNARFPSDHLPVVVDLRWRRGTGAKGG
eukprot:scaffold7.g3497.t1